METLGNAETKTFPFAVKLNGELIDADTIKNLCFGHATRAAFAGLPVKLEFFKEGEPRIVNCERCSE